MVYRFYCMALLHSQTRRHMIKAYILVSNKVMNKTEFLHRPILRIRVRDYQICNNIFIVWEYHNFSDYLDINVHQISDVMLFFNAINIIEILVLALTRHCLSGSPYPLTEVLGLAKTLFYKFQSMYDVQFLWLSIHRI